MPNNQRVMIHLRNWDCSDFGAGDCGYCGGSYSCPDSDFRVCYRCCPQPQQSLHRRLMPMVLPWDLGFADLCFLRASVVDSGSDDVPVVDSDFGFGDLYLHR